jgi:hypothetical protein
MRFLRVKCLVVAVNELLHFCFPTLNEILLLYVLDGRQMLLRDCGEDFALLRNPLLHFMRFRLYRGSSINDLDLLLV